MPTCCYYCAVHSTYMYTYYCVFYIPYPYVYLRLDTVYYPYLHFLHFSIHCLCVHLLLCSWHSIHIYKTVHYTPSTGTLCILFCSPPACTLNTVLCTLYAVQYTVIAYALTTGQFTPCTRVLHALNTWVHATLICTLPFETNHVVSLLFLLLMKMTGIYFTSVIYNIFCYFCLQISHTAWTCRMINRCDTQVVTHIFQVCFLTHFL